jgi:peroxiredoxin/predicted nucleic-acid-binding Zn-ribbon protein
MTTDTARITTGSAAPDVDVPTPAGGSVRLSMLWLERPIVLAFLGDLANPFTGDRAAQLRDANEYVEQIGADACAISGGTLQQAAAFRERWSLPYPVLPDHERQAFAAFGVERTATFVIDTSGVVRYERRDNNLADFPATTEIFAAVCAITGAETPAPPSAPVLEYDTPSASETADGKPRWICGKCAGIQYDRTQLSSATGMLVRGRKFEAVSCLACGYTELYRQGAVALA